jgi:hypothetical protein
MAPIWTDLNQATRLVTEATGRVAAQRALVSSSSVVHVKTVEKLEECVELLAVAVQHLLDVRLNATAVRGNGRTDV